MGFKLNMHKVYDRVEWNFLEATMVKMGFEARWVQIVMTCVTSVHFAILVNGSPGEWFRPSRGIRQGDPMSPYLFLICAEVLSSLLSQTESKGIITGVPSSPKGPKITHLFFFFFFFCR
jgi:hypothetical protein